MNKKAFSLIELLIVMAIMAILAGLAVPYYNDYIVDSRRAVLDSNIATIRKAINQFRADNQRGPARVNIIVTSAPSQNVNGLSDPFDELVNGPLQNIGGQWRRRSNLKYLNTFPQLLDPQTGQAIATSPAGLSNGQLYIKLATGSCWFGPSNNTFDIEAADTYAFIDTDGNSLYDSYDVKPFKLKEPNGGFFPLDYIDIQIVEKGTE